MGRIGLHEFAGPEVELPGGHVYTVTPATRAVTAKAKVLEVRIEALGPDPDTEEIVAIYCETLDLRLASVAKGQPRASTVIKKLWESEKITLQQLVRLLVDIGDTDRPI